MPEKVLLLCDGFDELVQQEPILSIMKKLLHKDVKMIVTTRPHGVTLLQRESSQAVEGLAKILGFSNTQIVEYIKLFYKTKHDQAKGERLYKHLQTNPSLLELANIGIRLEMICIVWRVNEDLGEHLVDLYIRFIQYLLDHLEKKKGLAERTSEELIMVKYEPLLLKIAFLANSWNWFGKLQTVMSYSDLKERLGENLKNAIDLGCVVKYNPSHNLTDSAWMFTHLSLQEFFLAFHLAKTDDNREIADYAKKCSSFDKLQKQKVVLTFLCGLNPVRANNIIQTAVKSITDDQECSSLLSYLNDLIPHYRMESQVDLALPKLVDATKHDVTKFKCLFNSDNKEHNRNLHTLLIGDITDPVYRKNLMYLKELTIIDKCRGHINRVGDIKDIAASMKSVTAINVKLHNEYSEYGDENSNLDFKQLFEHLPKEKIISIKLQGSSVIKHSTNSLGQFVNLQFLELSESALVNELCKAVKPCKLLNQVNLNTKGLPSELLSLDNKIKLNLTVSIERQDEIHVEKFIKKMKHKKTTPNISTLNLRVNLKSAGEIIGKLMVCLPGIEVLDLRGCKINASTLEKMSSVIRRKNTRLEIKHLLLGNENLHNINTIPGDGLYLQQILDHTPSLHTLDMYKYVIKDKDVENLTQSNTCEHINRLRLYTVDMEREASIRRLICKCHMLHVLCLYNEHDINSSHILSCIEFRSLPQLRVLSLCGYDLSGSLYGVVGAVKNLEALSVADCLMMDIHDLINCISSLPSLTHLDIHYNKYGREVLEITKKKQDMLNLQKLNIGPMYEKDNFTKMTDEYMECVSAVREELQEYKPDLQIYCDENENMWEMYRSK